MERPVIHMNGTSAEQLLEGYAEMIYALNDALSAMHRNGPNGRDYYPNGDDSLLRAQREHKARIDAVTTVWKELSQIAETIDT